jgi:ABC-type transport system substrate-binding protein
MPELTEYKYRALMVLTAEERETANALAIQLDPAAGPDTFGAALSADGHFPATHYWCSVLVTEAQWGELLMMKAAYFPTATVTEWYMEADPQKPRRLLAELGLKVINDGI